MSDCFCAALAQLAVLADDPREETRLRRTLFGIEIQRWRLASTIVVPDGGVNGPARDEAGIVGASPRAVRVEEPTLENTMADDLPYRLVAHGPA
ncbi:MAG: hypothetical protein ABI560_00795 [Myxococcales bacterium]